MTRRNRIALIALPALFAAATAVAQNHHPAHGTPATEAHPAHEAHPAQAEEAHEHGAGPELFEPNNAPATLQVTFPDATGGAVPQDSAFNSFGCTGNNRSLHIRWASAPAGTRSFMVIIHDPDAPTGVGFFHWTVFNIPANVTELATDASHTGLPQGAVQGGTDFGQPGYGGPCPPPGENHRYIATVYALDVPSLQGAGPTATGAFLRFMARGHTLALGRATATYHRP